MYFTNDDYRKIQQWLQHNSIKDTDLPDIETLKGNETLVIVQNGKNVKTSLSEFINLLFSIEAPDFINATARFNAYSIDDVIKSVPSSIRKPGQIVTFITKEGEWKKYQFIGQRANQWNINSLWTEI